MRKVLFIVLLALATVWSAGAQNSSVKRLENQRAQLEKDIARLNSMLNQNTMRSSELLSSLTLVRRKISAREQLIASYDQTLKINPDYAPVLNNYAYYLSLEGKQLKKAYTMSKKTIEQEPDNATYLDTFAWILHLMGRDLEAKPFFKHAMLYGGKESAVILEHYAVVLEALGENDTAGVYRNMAGKL